MKDKEIKEYEEIYYLQKFLVFLMFDNSQKMSKEMDWIYDINVLQVFKNLIEEFGKWGCLRPQVQNNIYNILAYGRNIIDENYKQRIQKINDIIIVLNSLPEQDYMKFYCGQLSYRIEDPKVLKKITVAEVKNSIHLIEDSICTDFLVLLSHSKDVSNEEFVNDYLPEFINNGFYYESLNMIMKECPSYFKDELFVDRMNSVIEMNRQLHPYFNGKSRKIKKKIKKYN